MIDLQTYLNNAVSANRQKTLANSDQLTLGELLLKLKPILDKNSDKKPEGQPTVSFDFGTAQPTDFGSWRGAYEEIALGYQLTGYDVSQSIEYVKLNEFYKKVEAAIGQTFEGWKGGDFTMNKNTPVWVANSGNSSHSAIVEVIDNGYDVILVTGYREY